MTFQMELPPPGRPNRIQGSSQVIASQVLSDISNGVTPPGRPNRIQESSQVINDISNGVTPPGRPNRIQESSQVIAMLQQQQRMSFKPKS